MPPLADAADALDPDVCYRVSAARDARWDGRFVLAVTTTRIYCRPSCPARQPRPENCRYFRSPSAAAAAGFRACKRCRPDAVRGTRSWDENADLAARAVRLVREGVVDAAGVSGLASRLAVSERQLHRVLVNEVGASPQQLARSRRARTARTLVEQTRLGLADVAFAAGFSSVRQFNDVMRQEFGSTPSALRAASRERPAGRAAAGRSPGRDDADGTVLSLRLRFHPPLAAADLARRVELTAVPGTATTDRASQQHTRVLSAPGGPALVTVTFPDDADHLPVRLQVADLADVAPVVAAVRRWLDLDADPALVDGVLADVPRLAPLVLRRPGLRLPGAADTFESAAAALLGRGPSPARSPVRALLDRFGTPIAEGLSAFPRPAAVAAAGTSALQDALGVGPRGAAALHGLAVAACEGLLPEPADAHACRRLLLDLPGLGPAAVERVALHALGDPDAFPAGDVRLRAALVVRTSHEAEVAARAWRPWRGYAALHLLTAPAER